VKSLSQKVTYLRETGYVGHICADIPRSATCALRMCRVYDRAVVTEWGSVVAARQGESVVLDRIEVNDVNGSSHLERSRNIDALGV
jgi:hypothetical protein